MTRLQRPILGGFLQSVPIGDISLHSVTFEQTVDWITARAVTGSGGVVCTPNADYVVKAHRNPALRHAIQAADLRVADGMGVVYASRLAGVSIRHTVTGRLLVPAIAARAAHERWPIALYGAGEGIAAEAARTLESRYPGLRVAAAVSPPNDLVIGSSEDDEAVRGLADTGARVIFVALGAPKQEEWMIFHRDHLSGVVLVGVGAALDILAGRFREAPRWMTRIGAEWTFRLLQEPRRLARRYLLDDPWIFWWAIGARLGSAPRRKRR